MQSLSIVVPAFNEAATIAAVVRDALRVGANFTTDLEVLVCDDASSDNTAAILLELARTDPRLRVLRRQQNRGIEASIRTLYAESRGAWVFLNSADGQWPMTALEPMAAAVDAGADLVIGIRANKRQVYSTYRQLLSRIFQWTVGLLGAPGGDPGSIKLGRRPLLHAAVVSHGVFSEGERVIRAARSGATIVEVEVPFRPRGAGIATGARAAIVIRAAADFVRVVCSILFGFPRAELPVSDISKSAP